MSHVFLNLLLVVGWSTATVMAASPTMPTHEDVRYGKYHRNVLDVYLPKTDEPRPVLIHLHGGGWMMGDKGGIDPNWYLENGMVVVSANYRFTVGSPNAAPFPAPLEDAARIVQFVRSKSEEWNLNSDRIAIGGISAGAVMAMWVGYLDDMAEPESDDPVERLSTRVCCVLPLDAPTTFEREWILKHVGGPKRIHIAAYPLFRIQNLDELDTPAKRKVVQMASPVTHVTADDPPTFMQYRLPMEGTPLPETADQNQSIHHPRFGQYLKECLDDAGVPCVFRYKNDNEKMTQQVFLKKHLLD